MSAAALRTGTEIGGFQLTNVVGSGGFGITYRAEEKNSGRVYAIKEYLPEKFATRDFTGRVTALQGSGDTYQRGLEAFLTEANILKELPKRKGLVRVRGAFEKFGTAYCVMEYIEGDNLDLMAQRLIRQFGYVPENLLADLAVAICHALDALHREGVIHRDVKPANIMLRRSGEPVLIDFGAARRLTRKGKKESIFTQSYAALEQIPSDLSGMDRELAEGPWTDFYSLSLVLYQLVARRLPPNAIARSQALQSGAPDPYRPLMAQPELRGGSQGYSTEILQAIDRGCNLMPLDRFRNASEFAEQLSPNGWEQVEAEPLGFAEDPADDWTVHAAAPVKQRSGSRVGWIVLLIGAAGAATVFLGAGMIGFE